MESSVKAITIQPKSLDSLPKIVFDNKIALDYLLAEQGGVYVAVNTTCAWINTPGEVETQLHKITEQATWL